MRITKIFLYTLALSLLLVSCKGGKTVIGSTTADASLAVASIIKTHKAASPNFKTLASRVQVAYADEKKEQSVTVSLRMEKDKVIWIKAALLGITIAKVKITPERVSYYETISNTYFDGDFDLLSDWLGTDLDFDKTQAILLGQSIFSLEKGKYTSSISSNKYELAPKSQPNNFIHRLLLNPDNYKVNSGYLNQPNDDRELSMRYGDYQKLNGSFYPTQVFIKSSEGDSETNIAVKYKKIDLNVDLSFPFNIPSGYEEIELSK